MPDNLIAMKLHFTQSAAKLKSRIFFQYQIKLKNMSSISHNRVLSGQPVNNKMRKMSSSALLRVNNNRHAESVLS